VRFEGRKNEGEFLHEATTDRMYIDRKNDACGGGKSSESNDLADAQKKARAF